jgi:hypothetical protein
VLADPRRDPEPAVFEAREQADIVRVDGGIDGASGRVAELLVVLAVPRPVAAHADREPERSAARWDLASPSEACMELGLIRLVTGLGT